MGVNGIPGASLCGWYKFFPKAHIYGADIDKDIVINNDRIHTYYVDQTNTPVIQELLGTTLKSIKYDFILDDGLHLAHANSNLLTNAWPYLKENGVYIIEDIKLNHLSHHQKYLEAFRQAHSDVKFAIIMHVLKAENPWDSVQMILQKGKATA